MSGLLFHRCFLNQREYVYFPNSGLIGELEGNDSLLFDAMDDGTSAPDLSDRLSAYGLSSTEIDEMLDSFHFALFGKETDLSVAPKGIGHLTLLVARDCNLACSYCYAGQGRYNRNAARMSFRTAKDAINYLVSHRGSDRVTVTFFGGEPLLNFDLIRQVVAYCHEIEGRTGIHFLFGVTTNGTLLTDEVIDYLIREHIGVQVSVDGDRSTHNSNRCFRDGSGSYDLVIRNSRKLLAKTSASAHATIADPNKNLVKVFKVLDEIGFTQIRIASALSAFSTKDDYLLLSKRRCELFDYFETLIKDGNVDSARKMTFEFRALKRFHYRAVRSRHCGAGLGMRVVDVDGSLYPCHRLAAQADTFLIGNIANTSNIQRALFAASSRGKDCEICWCRNICAGGCYGLNYEVTGSVSGHPNGYCEYFRNITERALVLYLKLTKEDMKLLFCAPCTK